MKKQSQKRSRLICLLISLVAAVALWAYVVTVVSTEKSATIYNIPVTFTGLDTLQEQNLTVTEGLDATVTLQLTGRRTLIQELNQDNISLTVDVSKITTAGTYSRNYNISYPSGISGINVDRRMPGTIDVTVEELESREIPVKVAFQGSAAEGYMIGSSTAAFDAITITGTADQVDAVSAALVIVNDQNLTSGFVRNMDFTLVDGEGNPVDDTGIEKEVDTIKVTVSVVKYKEVPLVLNFTPGGGATEENVSWESNPKTITVSGDEKLLDGLNQITLGTENLSGIVADTTKTYPIVLPDGVKNETGEAEATVTIAFRGLTSTTLRVSNFEFTGVPTGYVAKAVTQSLQITVRGPSSEIKELNAGGVRVVADLSGLSGVAGTYTVDNVTVALPGSEQSGVLGSYSVMVTLMTEEDYLNSTAENNDGLD